MRHKLSSNLFKKTTTQYQVETRLFHFNHDDNFGIIEIDSFNNKIHNLKLKDFSINHALDHLTSYENKKNEFIFDLELTSKSGITQDGLKDILLEYYNEKKVELAAL